MFFVLGASLFLGIAAVSQAQTFVQPAPCPTCTSTNYVGKSNFTLTRQPVVRGLAFDRIIQIWMENTDFNVAQANPTFQKLAKEGIALSEYYGCAHPSEENYLCSCTGDIWGLNSDNFFHLPANVSTIVDLLEEKEISWASYNENQPTDGFQGLSFSSFNYLDPTAPPYPFYMRKHNHCVDPDSVSLNPQRARLQRNFNDFAHDANASAIPQWLTITPNVVNDAHDTDIEFGAAFLEYFLVTLLENPNFNDGRTMIVLTFDENDTDSINNRVYTLLLGGAIPSHLRGTTDSTFYTHYSLLSTVQANWKLGSLGRQDTNKTVSNVFSWVADITGYKNKKISGNQIPLLNSTGGNPGPLNPQMWTPALAPNVNAKGAGGGPVFISPGTNLKLTQFKPINLTALGLTDPESGPGVPTTTKGH